LSGWGFHAAFFNVLYNFLFLSIFKISYDCINKFLDKGFFEYFGPFGVYKSMRFLNIQLKFVRYSLIFFSLNMMFLCLVLILLYVISALIFKLLILFSNMGIIVVTCFVLFLLGPYGSISN